MRTDVPVHAGSLGLAGTITQIVEGTNRIQRVVAARELLRDVTR
jgi:alkylation response protein AidB-like acyl-CoA dehydrogenase